MNNNKFKNLYKVQKTITFELKSNWKNRNNEADKVEFEKTQSWVDSLFQGDNIEDFDEKNLLPEVFLYSDKLSIFARKLGVEIVKKSFDLQLFDIHKLALENIDRNLYHQTKNKNLILQETNINGRKYDKIYKLGLKNNLLSMIKILGDNGYLIDKKLSDLSDKVNVYRSKVKMDYEYKFNQNLVYKFSGNANYHKNIKMLAQSLNDLNQFLSYFTPGHVTDFKNNDTFTKLKNELVDLQQEGASKSEHLKILSNFANSDGKQEFELTTLNHRAVNKDPQKLNEQIKEIEKLENDIKTLEYEIQESDKNKFKITEDLENKLKNNLEVLQILKHPEQINQNATNGPEYGQLKDFKFAKKALKYAKMYGVVVNSRNDIQNYGKINERIVRGSQNLSSHLKYHNFAIELGSYQTFQNNKRTKSVDLGNKKALYNSISREVLRQQKCSYFSLLVKDNDNHSPYFYLILVPSGKKDEMNQTLSKIKNSAGEWSCLDFNRLNFKSLEKLALLNASTFEIQDLSLQYSSKNI